MINRRRKFFTQYSAPRAVELADALVGAQTTLQHQHRMLNSGMYAFVVVDDRLYVARGISYILSRDFDAETLKFK